MKIIIVIPNKEGALFNTLVPFAGRDINIEAIQSIPDHSNPKFSAICLQFNNEDEEQVKHVMEQESFQAITRDTLEVKAFPTAIRVNDAGSIISHVERLDAVCHAT